MNTIVSNERVVRQVLGVLGQHNTALKSDAYAKKLFAWNTTLLYLEGILQKRNAVGEIAQHLSSTPWMQKWTNLSSIDGSALNRRLRQLSTDVLKQTYTDLVARYARTFGLPRPLKHFGPLAAVDATVLTLGKVRGEWAYQQKGHNAVKMHVSLDLTGEKSAVPSRVVLSTACVADLDREVTGALVTRSEATHLLDRGYIDYGQFLRWNREKIRFVARLKANSKVKVILQKEDVGPSIEQDAQVELTDSKTGETGIFRLVTYSFTDQKRQVAPCTGAHQSLRRFG
ncbi:transposase [Cohnella rhizosphaerae]|uniref:Transposase n=1 Tax=Cohnella rhizosphaerae TaxID=1457232 RepID=A0A9X4KNT3_9BACL|nr:transposase [Cohnella rhizosphaerae]MDG0808065.1 transposase [Cohnella rhizosphaerae]